MENTLKIADAGYQYVHGVGNCCSIFAKNGTGFIAFVLKKDGDECYARRLVAAFNATRHVPVETLETDPLTLDGVEDTFNRLKAQNAQLLDALEEIAAERDQYSVRAIAKHAIAAATSTEKTETP